MRLNLNIFKFSKCLECYFIYLKLRVMFFYWFHNLNLNIFANLFKFPYITPWLWTKPGVDYLSGNFLNSIVLYLITTNFCEISPGNIHYLVPNVHLKLAYFLTYFAIFLYFFLIDVTPWKVMFAHKMGKFRSMDLNFTILDCLEYLEYPFTCLN